MTSNTRLLRLYRSYNRRFFYGQLPAAAVFYENIKGREDTYGDVNLVDGEWQIRIHPLMNPIPEVEKITLLHEMIHLQLHEQGKNWHGHGRTFQSEIARLVRLGAYKKLL